MRRVIIDFKDCALTVNTGFKSKTIDDQVSLNRKLTFRHRNAYVGYFSLAGLSIMKTVSADNPRVLNVNQTSTKAPRSSKLFPEGSTSVN